MAGGPVDLILGVGVTKCDRVVSWYSHEEPEAFKEWLELASRAVPPNFAWFAKCWDQVLVEVLTHGDFKFILAAHECVGRGEARDRLSELRDELLPGLKTVSPLQGGGQGVERALKSLACSIKGVVPPRKVLVLYEGAPKRFLTKEDQAPELLEVAVAKMRLQKALEAADEDEDAFVFNLGSRSAARHTMEAEAEDDFTFNFPPHRNVVSKEKSNSGQQQQQNKKKALIYTIQVAAGPLKAPPQKIQSKKTAPSPGRSGDFMWNGVRVSPDDVEEEKAQEGGDKQGEGQGRQSKLLAKAFQSTIHKFSGRFGLFSGQFDKEGQRRQGSAQKLKGAVGNIAPSGLSWEDEIASQLAAAGVKVCAASGAGGPGAEEKEEEDKGSPSSDQHSANSPASVGRPKKVPAQGFNRQRSTNRAPAQPVTSEWQNLSLSRHTERGLGLGRLAKSLRKTFRHDS